MKNNKIDFLEEICFKYLEERGKHFKNNWLNIKGIWNRFLSPLKQSNLSTCHRAGELRR